MAGLNVAVSGSLRAAIHGSFHHPPRANCQQHLTLRSHAYPGMARPVGCDPTALLRSHRPVGFSHWRRTFPQRLNSPDYFAGRIYLTRHQNEEKKELLLKSKQITIGKVTLLARLGKAHKRERKKKRGNRSTRPHYWATACSAMPLIWSRWS